MEKYHLLDVYRYQLPSDVSVDLALDLEYQQRLHGPSTIQTPLLPTINTRHQLSRVGGVFARLCKFSYFASVIDSCFR